MRFVKEKLRVIKVKSCISRRDRVSQDERSLTALILEGLESGPLVTADNQWWMKKRKKLFGKLRQS
jgi:hypothetical protein